MAQTPKLSNNQILLLIGLVALTVLGIGAVFYHFVEGSTLASPPPKKEAVIFAASF